MIGKNIPIKFSKKKATTKNWVHTYMFYKPIFCITIILFNNLNKVFYYNNENWQDIYGPLRFFNLGR